MNHFLRLPLWIKLVIGAVICTAMAYALYLAFWYTLFTALFSNLNNDNEVIFKNYQITENDRWYILLKDQEGDKIIDDVKRVSVLKNDFRTQYRVGEDGFLAGLFNRNRPKYGAALYRDGAVLQSSWVTDPNRVKFGRMQTGATLVQTYSFSGTRNVLRPMLPSQDAVWFFPKQVIPEEITHDVIEITFPSVPLGLIKGRIEENRNTESLAETAFIEPAKRNASRILNGIITEKEIEIRIPTAIQRSIISKNGEQTEAAILFGTVSATIVAP